MLDPNGLPIQKNNGPSWGLCFSAVLYSQQWVSSEVKYILPNPLFLLHLSPVLHSVNSLKQGEGGQGLRDAA